jgi:hypothetical protein
LPFGAQVLHQPAAHVVADGVVVPDRAGQQVLHASCFVVSVVMAG